MTLKEYMKIHHPENVNDTMYNGGVVACPHMYGEFAHMKLSNNCNIFKSCYDCWNQEYIPKEGEEMGTKYKDGRKDECFNACEKLENTVWDFACKILDMYSADMDECFGTFDVSEIMTSMSYREAKEKYDTYIENKIKVGDEISDGEETGYVLWIKDKECMAKLGSYDCPQSINLNKRNFHKTGRHNTKLAEVMREISET